MTSADCASVNVKSTVTEAAVTRGQSCSVLKNRQPGGTGASGVAFSNTIQVSSAWPLSGCKGALGPSLTRRLADSTSASVTPGTWKPKPLL